MDLGWLAAIGAVALAVLGRVVVWIIGSMIADEAVERVFRRHEFARRRGRETGWLRGATFAMMFAMLAAVMCLAAATSGVASDGDDARVFGAITLFSVLLATWLFKVWWVRADPSYSSGD